MLPDAIRRSIDILARHRSLFGGGARTMSEVEITRVVEVFEANQCAWALIGAHAVGLLTEPRATVDFDFVIEGGKLPAVLRDLGAEFGELRVHDVGGAIELEAIAVDLVRSTNHPLFHEAVTQVRRVGTWNVPRTEVLVVLKFLAAISPWRNRPKRAQDAADLAAIYLAIGAELDRAELSRLAAFVYPDADRELARLLDKLDRGEPITI